MSENFATSQAIDLADRGRITLHVSSARVAQLGVYMSANEITLSRRELIELLAMFELASNSMRAR